MNHRLLLAALVLCGVWNISSRGQCAIVLTPVQTSLPTSTNVTVNLFATWDGSNSPGLDSIKSNDVAAYRFRLQLSGAVSGLSAAYSAGSLWANIAKVGGSTPAVNSGSQQITFEGANTQSPPSSLSPITNVDVGQTQNASTLLGTFNFTALPGTYTVSFAMLNSSVYPTLNGFSFVGSNSTTPGNQVSHSVFAPPTNLLIAAVPEPSSLACCALAGVACGIFRRRLGVRKAKPSL